MANQYYVSPLGNDGNPGTIDEPFKSIQQAIDRTANESRTLYLRGGTYDITEGTDLTEKGPAGIYVESWNGGNENTSLTIQAYADEQPILDASNVGDELVSVLIEDVQNVSIIGLEVTSAPFHGIEIVNGKNVNILNNTVHDSQGTGISVRGYLANVEGSGNTEQRSENVRIEGNSVYRNVLSNSGELKGANNWAGALFVRHAANVTIANNKVYENYGEGIITLHTTAATVERNTVYDNFSVNVYLDNTSHSTVANNFIYTTDNQEFFRFDEAGYANPANNISLANEEYSSVDKPWLYYQSDNVVANNVLVGGSTGVNYGTYAGLHSDQGQNPKGLRNIQIVNNTVYNPHFSFVKLDEDPGTQNVHILNNIFSRPESDKEIVDIDSIQGVKFNHNLWHGIDPWSSAATEQAIISPKDVIANPDLLNPGGTHIEDYRLKDTSPVLNNDQQVSGAIADALWPSETVTFATGSAYTEPLLGVKEPLLEVEQTVTNNSVINDPIADATYASDRSHTSLWLDLRYIDLDGNREADSQVGLSFSNVSSAAAYNNTVGFYVIEDEAGAVKDPETQSLVYPGEAGYNQLAINQRLKNIQLNRYSPDHTIQVQGGQLLAPYLIVDGDIDDLLSYTETSETTALDYLSPTGPSVYFAFSSANADGVAHVQESLGQLQFEDLWGGGDQSFNDFTVSVDVVSSH